MFKLIFKILKKKNKLYSPSLSNSEWCPQGKLGHFEYKEFVMAAMKWLIGKDPDAGKDWRQEERGRQRMRWLNGITKSRDMSLSKL